jgi:lipid-binding SYLF domain-containing protein
MKTKITMISILLVVFSMTGLSQDNDVDEARKAITEFKETNSDIIEFFNSAYGYAIFPGIGKGGLGVGGAAGKGTVFKGGTPVADCKMSQVTIGFQAGGQKYAEVIFFENVEAYERFVGNKFEFAAQVSAVALKSGVSLDAEYADGMLVFTMAIGGLMYEASIGGQKFKTEMY